MKGDPDAGVSFAELADIAYFQPYALPPGMPPGLEACGRYAATGIGLWACATHVCTCEVDVTTGKVTLLRYIVGEDCGHMINPAVVEGQIAGGVVQGIGGALLEELAYDADGNPVATTFMDYLLPTAAEVPLIEYAHVETAPGPGPGGYKGVGEGGAIGAPPAVVNAVADALAPFGVTITRLPLSPAAIVELIDRAGGRRWRPGAGESHEAGPFEYHAPASAKEAVGLLAELGDGAKVIAGGQSLVPVLAMRLAVFDHLIDIRRIEALRGIEERGDSVWIGAGTTEAADRRLGADRQASAASVSRHTADRPLPDPQPRHHRRIAGPRGRVGRVPGGGPGPGRDHRGAVTARPADDPGGGVLHRHLDHRAGAGRAAHRGQLPVGDRARAPVVAVDGRLRDRGVRPPRGLTSRWPARRRRSRWQARPTRRRTRRPGQPVRHWPVRPRPDSAAAPPPLRHPLSASPPSDINPAEIGRAAVADLDSVPSDLHGTADYRKKVGAAMVARAWEKAVEEAANG